MKPKIFLRKNDKGEIIKSFRSDDFNYVINLTNGMVTRWGKGEDDDPPFSPYGPEIMDLEVSTICGGINNKPCSHCYKNNTSVGKNMSFETFQKIFHKIPPILTQIAFGIGDLHSNPDLFKMFDYCQNNSHNPHVRPNLTTNGWGLTDEDAKFIASVCGSIAVSRYSDKDVCYNAVKKLTDAGMKQTNIHQLLSEETYPECFKVIDDIKNDPRLKNYGFVVFLLLKPKGKRNILNTVKSSEKYRQLINYARDNGVRYGFDSCSGPKVLDILKDEIALTIPWKKLKTPSFKVKQMYEDMMKQGFKTEATRILRDNAEYEVIEKVIKYSEVIECCESSLLSSYINIDGRYFHCSFTEGQEGWQGVDVLNCEDFLKDVWYHPETVKFRNKLLDQEKLRPGYRRCHLFNLYDDEKFIDLEQERQHGSQM